MNKLIVYTLVGLSLLSLSLTGVIVSQGLSIQTENLIVEFEFAGRFEVIYSHHGITQTSLALGIQQIPIARNIGEHWEITFIVQKMEVSSSPLFVYLKTLDGEIIYSTNVVEQDGILDLDCETLCTITGI